MNRLRYQGLVYFATAKRDLTDSTYKDLQTVKFRIKLLVNQYVNLNSVHLCFPIKLSCSKSCSKDFNYWGNMITANNFFTRQISKVKVKRYGDDLKIVPSSTADMYRYSDGILEYRSRDNLETFEKKRYVFGRTSLTF